MKTFTKIPNEVGIKFTPNDVYTLTAMYLTAKYNEQSDCYETDVTIQQLANLTGLSFAYTKDKFLPRLKESKFCKIELITEGYKDKRNRYYLPNSKSNFRIINSRVLTDNKLTPKDKGFLISLFTICENKSFNCGLVQKEILDLLKVSKSTFDRFTAKLTQQRYLITFDDIDLFDNFNYCTGIEINCNWIGSTSDNLENLKTEVYTKASTFLTKNSFNFSIAV